MEGKRADLLAQLLARMNEKITILEEALKNKDPEHLAEVKKEILMLQRRIGELL